MTRDATIHPDWWTDIEARLDHLRHLEVGWDGYKAPPVAPEIANSALRLLAQLCGEDTPMPSIVPGSAGDLQIEWHTAGWDLELDVLTPGRVEAWRQDLSLGREQELAVGDDLAEVRTWIAQLGEQGLASRAATA